MVGICVVMNPRSGYTLVRFDLDLWPSESNW